MTAGGVDIETAHGRVRLLQRRRRLRLEAGGARLELGHLRPIALVTPRGETLSMSRPSDPWINAVLGALVLWATGAVLLATARWLSERRDGTTRAVASD